MIVVRAATSLGELEKIVALQQRIWGFAEIDLLPRRLFVVAHRIGGQVLGAFEGEAMVGFAVALPGRKPDGMAYLHSHMTGVVDSHRDRGVGRLLKLAQRDDALARGIELMEWTFDPLQVKNAFFNLARLGAVVRQYERNHYGFTSSALQAGLPTDRCVAEWWMRSERVERAISRTGSCEPLEPQGRVTIDGSVVAARGSDVDRATEALARIALAFDEQFQKGLAATSFERASDGGGSYLFTPWDSPLTE